MRVLFASSEVFPLVKTGGLADVSGALPGALTAQGVDVRVLMPGYPQALDKVEDKDVLARLGDPLGVGAETRLVGGRLPGSDVPVWLLDCPHLYDRAGGPYQDIDGSDYADNALRFGMLSWAAAHLCTGGSPLAWEPEVLHCHDWQTGLAAAYLQAWDVIFRPSTVFTIHNIAYQGQFPPETLPRLGLPWSMYTPAGLEYWSTVSFLKAGLIYSDRLTTVSPRYAREIQSAPHGSGMEGVLAERSADLVGILNGVDYSVWDPASDPYIDHRYTKADVQSGKAANKAALQAELGLAQDPAAPLLIVVSRLNDMKGMDLVLAVLPGLLDQGAQLAVLGTGDRALEAGFRAAADANPRQVSATLSYSEGLAHKLMAAGDILVMPSRSEPCGLTQFYAFRYGTVPLVHIAGGLADTVVDTTYDGLMTGTANGFAFDHANAGAFRWTLDRALAFYAQKDPWRKIQANGMGMDYGWDRSATRYVDMYRALITARRGEDA